MSHDDLMEILLSKPDYLHSAQEELPFFIKRVKRPANPLSKLKFEPNKVAQMVFECETPQEAKLWRLKTGRINHGIYSGEPGEGKTSIGLGNSDEMTKLKRQFIRKARRIPDFSIERNFKLGQFVTLRSQVIFAKLLHYEEVFVDELELCINRARSMSGQNLDARNTYDAGRFTYIPINGSVPSIGSIDKEISSTKIQWNYIAEYNRPKRKVVDVIVKFNVHSRDNYEFRWVNFIEMQLGWCDETLYRQAEEIKRRMIATYEGLKSKKRHLADELEEIMEKRKAAVDLEADKLVQQYKNGNITRKELAWQCYSKLEMSINAIAKKIKANWSTVDRYITEKQKEYEEGKLTDEERKQVID